MRCRPVQYDPGPTHLPLIVRTAALAAIRAIVKTGRAANVRTETTGLACPLSHHELLHDAVLRDDRADHESRPTFAGIRGRSHEQVDTRQLPGKIHTAVEVQWAQVGEQGAIRGSNRGLVLGQLFEADCLPDRCRGHWILRASATHR